MKIKRMLKMETHQYVRIFLAELLGTFMLVVMGDGAVAQVVLGKNARNDNFFGGFLNICFGYGFALMVGICVSGGISGGHLNPAVTLSLAAIQKLPPIQIPIYMVAQYIGAFIAALVVWGEYADAIKLAESVQSPQNSTDYSGLTMGIFASYPTFPITEVSTVSLAMDQLLGTAVLLVIILSVTDEHNMKITSGFIPIIIGLGLTAIHLSFGLNAGSAINPARDLSPRILSLLAGYEDAFQTAKSWFWIPWLLPHLGGVIGALTYQFLIGVHHP